MHTIGQELPIGLQSIEEETPRSKREAPSSCNSPLLASTEKNLMFCQLVNEKYSQSPAPLSQRRSKKDEFELRSNNCITSTDAKILFVLEKKISFWLTIRSDRNRGFPGGAVVENPPAMQGTRVRAPVWEDLTCRGAARPVSHTYWACASGACAPQPERPRQWEARAPRWRVAPARRNWRKPSHRNKDPTQPKINK